MKKRWIGILTAVIMTAATAAEVTASDELFTVDCSKRYSNAENSDVWATMTTDGVLTIYGTGKMDSYFFEDEDVDDGYPWGNNENAELIDTIVVEEGVTYVNMVYMLPNLKHLYLPNSLESVNPFNWVLCTNLETVFIAPDTIINGDDIFMFAADNFTMYGYKGTYAEAYAAEFAYNFKAMGDMNGDGSVDLEDASDIIRTYAQHASGGDVSVYQAAAEESTAPDLADVNRDGAVEIADATLTMKYYAQTAAGLDADWTQLLTE